MASKNAEICLEVAVSCTARMVRQSYDHPGGTYWYEPEDINCDDVVCIEGVDVNLSVLPKKLQDLIIDMAVTAVDDEHGWEADE